MKAGYFSADVEEFLRLLNKHNVQYLIVGGEAVIYYGYPRLTGDIDFFYSSNDDNIENLYKVLLEFWANDIPGIGNKKELKTSGYVIQFGVPPNRIDLMNSIDGVRFDDAWRERKTEILRVDNQEVPVYLMGLDHLIINKIKSGREKDLDDLSYLKKLQ